MEILVNCVTTPVIRVFQKQLLRLELAADCGLFLGIEKKQRAGTAAVSHADERMTACEFTQLVLIDCALCGQLNVMPALLQLLPIADYEAGMGTLKALNAMVTANSYTTHVCQLISSHLLCSAFRSS